MVKRLIIVLFFLVLLFGGVFWFKAQQFQQMSAMFGPPPPTVVTSTQVVEKTWRPQLDAVGTVVAVQGVQVANEVPGLVREIPFESGQQVKKGDVLLQLDDAVDQAQLRGLQAALGLAQVKFQRASKLVKERSVSQSDYDTARAELTNAQAQVASQQALIEKKLIRAPFEGVLGLRAVSLGQYLPTGTAIVPLEQLATVFVDFSLPERYVSSVMVGQQVRVTTDGNPDADTRGAVIAIDPAVDSASRMLRLRARLSNQAGLLRPGMFTRVQLDLGRQENVLTLPRVAISYAPYGDAVFVIVEKDGKLQVQQRQVQTGAVVDDRVIVKKGVEAGERVVLTGQVKLRNDMPVQIDNTVLPVSEAASP